APSVDDPDGVSIEELIAGLEEADYPLVDLDPSRTYDISMIAAPVFGPDATVILALTLVGLPPGLAADRVVFFGEQVRDAGLVVTKRSLGRIPGNVAIL